MIRKHFSDAAIGVVIKSYKATIEMVQSPEADSEILEDTSNIQPEKHEASGTSEQQNTLCTKNEQFKESFRIKVGSNKFFTINYEGSEEIGVDELKKLISILEVQKEVLDD